MSNMVMLRSKKGHDYMIMTPTFMSEAWFGELEASQIFSCGLENGATDRWFRAVDP